MRISDKIAVQEIIRFAKANGIVDVVLSPGSRNAPFTISLSVDPFFTCHSVVDERSAGFIALGMAQKIMAPVILVCTSGSASLNYSPAIVEAYNQGIPLLVITCDRPENGYANGDGQCFNQKGVYNNYIKFHTSLIEQNLANTDQLNKNNLNTAFTQLLNIPFAPVHINVPFNEPLYNTVELDETINKTYVIEPLYPILSNDLVNWKREWKNYKSKLILVFQGAEKGLGKELLMLMKKDSSVYVMAETIANLNEAGINSSIDRTIDGIDQHIQELQPELIVTIGRNIISKKIKQLFRKHQPIAHWSFSNPLKQNYFEMEGRHLKGESNRLFANVEINLTSNFQDKWKQLENRRRVAHCEFLSDIPFSDLLVFKQLNDFLPLGNLQLGNSSVIRYAQLFDQAVTRNHFSNRGVSGIDGCTSTAMGYASKNMDKQTFLISGDLSFFYDSNAFWNDLVVNLTILVINNGGGSIFGIIDGPTKYPESLPYFLTPHTKSIKKFCESNGLNYEYVHDEKSLVNQLEREIKPGLNIVEVDTSEQENARVLKQYYNYLKSK